MFIIYLLILLLVKHVTTGPSPDCSLNLLIVLMRKYKYIHLSFNHHLVLHRVTEVLEFISALQYTLFNNHNFYSETV